MSLHGAGVAEMMFGHLRLLEDAIYIYMFCFIHVAISIIYIYIYTCVLYMYIRVFF